VGGSAFELEAQMTSTPAVYVTAEGWRHLHDDLRSLRERWQAAWGETRRDGAPLQDSGGDPHGDLTLLVRRIAELQGVLARAVPVDHADRVPGTVGVGSRVTLRWEADDTEETYTIVGPPEVAPHAGRISYESPVGRALVGRRTGDRVEAATLDGQARLAVVAVE
jgi:transcription elongation factor GreA